MQGMVMDEEKKAEVVALFRQIGKIRGPASERRRVRSGDKGPTIVGSTIVICSGSGSLQRLVAQLLEGRRPTRRTG
jgi:hypothetical protein